ncbi:MAG: macro domain-containing protein [Kineosporiaceae bacterium]
MNTVGVMGKGIALQFKRAFPANEVEYRRACASGELAVGSVLVHDTGAAGLRRYVLNVPTKRHWRSASRLDDVESGVAGLVDAVRSLGVASVAVPALGCGNGGLPWSDVRPLLVGAAEQLPQVRWVLYPPR